MGSEKKIVADSKRAWMMLASVVFSTFASGGLQMSFGTILSALVHEFGDSKSKTAWVGTLVTFFSCTLSPLTIFLAQKHGIHVTQFVGGAIMTVGAVSTSLVSTVDYMFLTYGVLLGISGALIYSPALATIPELFTKHVSIATGIALSGCTMGLIFFSFTLPLLLEQFGWRKMLWCLAALGPLVSVLGFNLPKMTITFDSNEKMPQDTQEPWWTFVNMKAYVLLSIAIFLFTVVDFVPLFLVPLCATESGMPLEQTKWFNIVFGCGSLVGRLFSGPLVKPLLEQDRCKYLYLACIFMHSASSFLVSLSVHFEYLMAYMVFIGLLNGTMASLFFLVILEVVGLNGYPVACGINLAICGISWTAGTPLAGLLFESLKLVKYLLLALSATSFLSAVVMATIPCVTPRRRYMLHQCNYDYWRVYCHNPNVSPKLARQDRAFTINEAAVKCQENLGYQQDVAKKLKHLAVSVLRTELLAIDENV